MVGNVGGAAIRALKKAVVTGTKVSISLGKSTAIKLLPRSRVCRVGDTIPFEQSNAVIGGPAVVGRVSDVCLAAEVERILALLNGDARLLPGLVRLRDDGDVGAGGDVVGVKLAYAGGLIGNASHAGVDKVVAPVVEADDGAVQGPIVGDLVGIAPVIPRGCSACPVIDMWLAISLSV